MATVAIVLKTSKKLSNNEYSVSLRVIHKRQTKYFAVSQLVRNQSLKWRCTVTDWKSADQEDNGLGKFRKGHPCFKECNSILESKLQEAFDILKRYDHEKIDFSFNQFEIDIYQKEKISNANLQNYYSSQIIVLEEQGRVGLAGLYLENKRILEKFNPSLLLSDINIKMLENFEYWLRNKRGNKDTSISVKMRNLQRVVNQAIEDKLYKTENYPFGEKKYSINKRLDHKTPKIAITTKQILKLRELELSKGTSLHFAQQICLFSYYCRGMNFIDITFLEWKDIRNSMIHYTRKKTRGVFKIPLNKFNKEIIAYFKSVSQSKSYVFPILNPSIHITEKQKYTRKKTALKAVNYNLKKIAKLIGESELKLSTNVFRHSYATGLKNAGVSVGIISEALGHHTQEQTHTYLADFDTELLSESENIIFDL